MAIVFEQIETSVVEAPVSPGSEQPGANRQAVEAVQLRHTFEIMAERAARLGAE
jgi:hypothetical protein